MAKASYSLNVRPLNNELKKIAENKLNEIPNRLQDDLDHIREWLSKQPHIHSRTDDQWILNFLRSCKFSLEKTKVKLEDFYSIKPILPEFFANRDPFLPEIQEVLKQGLLMVLSKVEHSIGPRIVMVRAERANPDKIAATTVIKTLSMLLETLFLEDDNYIIAGHCIVIDLHNLPYKYASQLTPEFIKKVIVGVREAQPIRIKSINYLNCPQFCLTIYNAFKVFFTDDIIKRTRFYNQNNMKDLYQTVPLSILPNEYGGTGGSCDEIAAQAKTSVEKFREWFLEDSQYSIDETKIPKHSKAHRNYDFGIEGSFRNLSID